MPEEFQVERKLRDEPSAFPMIIPREGDLLVSLGLTKRELFAAMAMQAIISKMPCEVRPLEIDEVDRMLARGAVYYADALIAELEKKEE